MSHDRYDPNAPEETTEGSSPYLSVKDLKWIGGIAVVLMAILYPMYRYGVRQSEKSRCSANMKAINDALNLYAENKEDRFPPLYRTGDNGEPGLGPTGLPYTWCDDVAPLMVKRYSFTCPSALPDEMATLEDPSDSSRVLSTTYGLYSVYGGFPRSLVAQPDQAALMAETSNEGSEGSFDPQKFFGTDGKQLPDGFVIGWDNSISFTIRRTPSSTRLAYRDTSNGIFLKDGPSRHDAGIHVLTVSGERLTLPPTAALIEHQMGSISGLWNPPVAAGK